MNYWQHAAGDTNRNYADICLKWDVILSGPGYAGSLPDCEKQLKQDKWTSKKITGLLRFYHEMAKDDIVVLRLGTTDVLGVGVICDNYQWLETFSDIDGWDLQHVRRVKWFWKEVKRFKTYTLKLGDTTQKLDSSEVINWLDTLPKYNSDMELVKLPNIVDDVSFSDISEYLFDKGISSYAIDMLQREIDELIKIAKWYSKYEEPSEFETVTYLVVPLLRVLGWTPQKMAIEWNKVDVALFNPLPRKEENLNVVVEVKRKGNSCLSAKRQAESYAIGKNNCKRLIVSDGLKYGIYLKKGNEFFLYAYFNLTDTLKNTYPIYECYGIKEALEAMTPEWNDNQHNNVTWL
ncbi:MAG: hypothetical protein KAH77_04835 [Thiomargarita sp.]|nr:hypothetical protein [Thiomargarita sp.]